MIQLPLRTKRLVLRDFKLTDFEAVCEFANDPEVSMHSTWGPNDGSMTRFWLKNAIEQAGEGPRTDFELAIELDSPNGAGQVIGTAHLGLTDFANRAGVMGYTLRRESWGHGYATEAAGAVLALGFGPLGLHRIIATTSPLNVASQRVLDKIGMRREGLLKQDVLQRGKWRDSVLYAILDHEWKR